ncbi:COG2078: Uncharacterized ACR [hydrothermal vent metagenome]|uniref:COG2078: Uncharacterized ACR n=1 Tax=hydrothermal vent metagenome TaxID=652676 RepID=A0A3B1B2M2_9ZZZZ
MPLSKQDRTTLLQIATDSICHGLSNGHALPVLIGNHSDDLKAHRASFVTLNRLGNLRGCIGHLEAINPLVKDVADNAFAAAFQDPRFPQLTNGELAGLEIHISVLTPATPMVFSSEENLISQLSPGQDGLILKEGAKQGTFLPSVWESLPRPEEFLKHLKLKARLPAAYWSDTIKVYRYETESFSSKTT